MGLKKICCIFMVSAMLLTGIASCSSDVNDIPVSSEIDTSVITSSEASVSTDES